MADDFKITGLEEVHNFLQYFPVRLEQNVLRGMIRAAAAPVVARARELAPTLKEADPRRSPGALKRSIRAMSTQVRGAMVKGGVAVGSRNKSLGRNDAFYAHMVEYGTAKDPAQPFLRPAISTETQAAIDAAVRYVNGRIADLTK